MDDTEFLFKVILLPLLMIAWLTFLKELLLLVFSPRLLISSLRPDFETFFNMTYPEVVGYRLSRWSLYTGRDERLRG
jgi:hypothetical protein